jgi:GAF domain-containing protein
MTNARQIPDPAEWRALTTRVIELEGERSDARDQAKLLTALHETFCHITATRIPQEVIGHMLRAAHDPLGFSRAIYFAITRERGIEAQFAIDGSDVVEASSEAAQTGPGSALVRLLRGDDRDGIGTDGDLSAPLVDVRRWYVMSALTGSEGPVGILYADGHRSRRPRACETELVRSLTAIGAISIENGILFAKTRELAMRDPLTGLYNRRAFAERLIAEIDATRRHGRALVYVMIDVDDFKA